MAEAIKIANAERLPLSERTKSSLRFRRDSSHNELICIYEGRLFNKSNRLPILPIPAYSSDRGH